MRTSIKGEKRPPQDGDLRLSDGQVVVPTTQEACRVDITLAEADDADPLARLL